MNRMYTVTFLPQNISIEVAEGTTLLAAEQEAGLEPVHRFEDLTFDPPAADSQRMVYAARKHQKEE